MNASPPSLVSGSDPCKNQKVWEIGWGGSVPRTWNVGALPTSSWLHAKPQPASKVQRDGNKQNLLAREVVGA